MDRGAWQTTVHRVTETQTQLSNYHNLNIHVYLNISRTAIGTSHSFVTPWTVTCQAPLSMRFPRQEY